MTCEFCGAQTTPKHVRKQHWLHRRLYVIENVPAEVCMQCGERYFHAKTLDDVDRLLEGKHAVEESLQVEVIRL